MTSHGGLALFHEWAPPEYKNSSLPIVPTGHTHAPRQTTSKPERSRSGTSKYNIKPLRYGNFLSMVKYPPLLITWHDEGISRGPSSALELNAKTILVSRIALD
ncbi:hypothetical protein NM688_g2717 [Phlebia brevispora]|uniref:Uncharacterized protein n=1 Tax=Phlebia brevispora TaxID=194682 RepID=A0ACC1T7P9_9APHY|nr:hypothetical protein NM688_g2717 [Phlebia brevispora]